MERKELLIPLYLLRGEAVCGRNTETRLEDGDAVRLAAYYENTGADGILLFDLSEGDQEHDEAIRTIREITDQVDIPVIAGGNIRRVEDVKKLLYAGCSEVFLNFSKPGNIELTAEVSARFGKEKILASCVPGTPDEVPEELREKLGGILLLCDEKELTDDNAVPMDSCPVPELPLILCLSSWSAGQGAGLLKQDSVRALAGRFLMGSSDCMEEKHNLQSFGALLNTFESSMKWEELRPSSDGLIPVVVQDYRTQEVLMVAYMNQEAFERTVRTGRMTYWSRSRKEIWVKGLTSGHFQYVRELRVDCDNDTLLAQVCQIGAACHTGNRSCFYRTIIQKEYDSANPLKVFEEVMQVILDRKEHPKEGSYTNYLFDKGIDKILKKVGEEATEIVIAAKNPDPEEVKYEISDFLYHVMVLMAEKGLSWEDITRELARR